MFKNTYMFTSFEEMWTEGDYISFFGFITIIVLNTILVAKVLYDSASFLF